jgi:hypothetical protein
MRRRNQCHQLICDHGCAEATGLTADEQHHDMAFKNKLLHEEANPGHTVSVIEPQDW